MEYLVAQDEECKLLTVGAWAAMTGYGAAFPRNSKHFMNFDRKVMDFSENGKNSLDIDLRLDTKICFFQLGFTASNHFIKTTALSKCLYIYGNKKVKFQ